MSVINDFWKKYHIERAALLESQNFAKNLNQSQIKEVFRLLTGTELDNIDLMREKLQWMKYNKLTLAPTSLIPARDLQFEDLQEKYRVK